MLHLFGATQPDVTWLLKHCQPHVQFNQIQIQKALVWAERSARNFDLVMKQYEFNNNVSETISKKIDYFFITSLVFVMASDSLVAEYFHLADMCSLNKLTI